MGFKKKIWGKIFEVPVIYALLPNKTKKTYTALLRKLKELEPNLAPISIMCDFQEAFAKAQCVAGGPPPAKKRRYQDVNTRLQNLVQGYDEDTTDAVDYLIRVAHNLAF